MTYDELLSRLDDMRETLTTVTGSRFTVGVYRDRPFFTPESTGLGRSMAEQRAEPFVARYNETRSPSIARLTRTSQERLVLHGSADRRTRSQVSRTDTDDIEAAWVLSTMTPRPTGGVLLGGDE